MYVPQIKKLPVTFAANDDCSNLKFVELKKLADKRRWQQRFADDYDGGVGAVVDALFEEPVVKCIVAADGCVFRSNWTLVPGQTDRSFRGKLDS